MLSLAAAVVVVLATLGGWLAYQASGTRADPERAAQTSLPDLTPATGAPPLPSLSTLRPRAGTVVEAPGPFDDRFHFTDLGFDGKTVKGTANITSDVSEILEFEAVAGFYNREGALIGTGRHTYHLDESIGGHADEGAPDEEHEFSIRVPSELRGTAVAAAVGVPVLVNE